MKNKGIQNSNSIKRIVLLLTKPNKNTYGFYTFLLILAIIFFLIFWGPSFKNFLIIFLIAMVYELMFRGLYYFYNRKPLPKDFRISSRDLPIESHPYLPWVYKKKYIPPSRKIYSEDRQGFMYGELKTNNIRHVNGPDGGREVLIPKPMDVYRILCLGDSTTANYVRTNNDGFVSYPLSLETMLRQLNKNIEVNNCGMGGYNSNEILIKFLIDTIDTDPDMVIFYHAFVNIRGYLTEGFERDFSHFRKSIHSNYPIKTTIAKWFPTFRSSLIKYLKGEYLVYGNVKTDLVNMINVQPSINKDKSPEGLEVFKRNLETLISVCKGRDIKLILSTYCYHLYDEIKESTIHQKFKSIVAQENEIIKELAKKNSIPIVDNAGLFTYDDEHFIDEVHPTEKGMELLASNFYDEIIKHINND
jgi:lysophospholipase L1-like esterase